MSTSNTLNFNSVSYVTLDEATKAIMLYGRNITPILVAEPGVGKSNTLPGIARLNGDQWREPGDYFPEDKYVYIPVDMSQKDFQDFFVYGPDRNTMKLQIFMADMLKTDDPRPHVIFLDEITKRTSKAMEAATAGMLLEQRFGEWIAPKGSIVYGAANNASDGVGDTMLAHCGNRAMFLYVAKPDNRQWARWAMGAGIDPGIIGWAIATPEAFHSYKTCSEEELKNNAMIFIPNKNALSFGSLRSYAACDTIIRNMPVAGESLTRAALAGTVGMAAAESMMTFLALGKDLPKFEEICADPMNTPVPSKFASQIFSVSKTILGNIQTQDELSACAAYVNRFSSNEVIALFHCLLAKTEKLQRLATNNAEHGKWMMANKNYELLSGQN